MKLLLAAAMLITGPGTQFYAGMPPARFQGPAIVRVVFAAETQLADLCGIRVEPGMILYGCSRSDRAGQPYVVVADPCPLGPIEQTARILCHEIAHATHGWGGNHPL